MPSGIYTRTEEHKRKIREGKLKRWKKFGYCNSPEARKKMSKAKKGKKRSEETRKKISESHKGKKCPWTSERNKKRLGEKNWNWKGGLTILQKNEIIAGRKKPEQCELCGGLGIICFDHDHKTGKFRGWICQRCNTALGLIKENTQTLRIMIEYLEKK